MKRLRLGLLLDTVLYSYQSALLLGAHAECERQGVDLLCIAGGAVGIAPDRNFLYDAVLPGDFDGIIISSGTIVHDATGRVLQGFVERFLGTRLLSVATVLPGVQSLLVDNVAGSQEVTRHLIVRHGRRRLAFVRVQSPEAELRFSGYRAALAAAGLPFDEALVVPGAFTYPSGVDAVAQLIDQRRVTFDALVCASDWLAIGAMDALRERGVQLPEEIAVTGFDDIEDARFVVPPLTTVRQPTRELGVVAVRALLQSIRGETQANITRIATTVSYRASCGCASNTEMPNSVPSATRGIAAIAQDVTSWQEMLGGFASELSAQLGEAWAQDLLGAFVQELLVQSGQFSTALEGHVTRSLPVGGVNRWHDVVRSLRRLALSSLGDDQSHRAYAENILEEAHVTVSRCAEQVQGRLRMGKEKVLTVLNTLTSELRHARNEAAVFDNIRTQVSRLAVPSLYVTLQVQGAGSRPSARVAIAHDAAAGSLLKDGDARVVKHPIIPVRHLPSRRHTLVVEPLFFGKSRQGACLVELGPTDGVVYETLREQLSSALHGSDLRAILIEEVTRRERAERARIEGELNLARRIQTGILPKSVSVSHLQIATAMIPANEVGGDYFDVLPVTNGCWLAVGDVTGHGFDAGLLMLMLQSMVATAVAQRPAASPAEIWSTVNDVLCENVKQRLGREDYATLTLLRYTNDGLIRFAGAHEDLVVLRVNQNHPQSFETDGIWAGIVPGFEATSGELRLAPGDVMLLYTDGMIEEKNGAGEMFGPERLFRALERARHEPVATIRDVLLEAAESWADVQADDRTLIVVRYAPA